MTDAAFAPPPSVAAWRHQEARDGFEVLRIERTSAGLLLAGTTCAVEYGRAWVVDYEIELDAGWTTRRAQVDVQSELGRHSVELTTDGLGHWQIDGRPAPILDGCLDVDLESSAATNTMPVHRLALRVGASAEAPAAYVRAEDAAVERLEQTYTRIADDGDRRRYRLRVACLRHPRGAGLRPARSGARLPGSGSTHPLTA